MAAKKNNVFNQESYQDLKQEVNNIVEYISDFDILNIEDEIDFKPTMKGGTAPSIVSTIEKKIQTVLKTIEQCAKILKALHDKEGMTPDTSYNIKIVVQKLKTIQTYYRHTPLKSVINRRCTKTVRGKTIDFLVRTRDEIIQERGVILDRILKIIPLIEEIESLEKESKVKGGYEIPERMKNFVNRN